MRVVADTNVFVRALTGGPQASPLMRLWKAGQIQLVVSHETLAELAAVLTRPKFQRYFTSENIQGLLTLLRQRGDWAEITSHLSLCRDPKDDIFLNLAVSAKASYVVSADNDLIADDALKTTMQNDHQIQIVREAELVSALDER
jgi:uncharacterized protein